MKLNQFVPATIFAALGLFVPLSQAQTTVLDNTSLSSIGGSTTLASYQSGVGPRPPRITEMTSGFTTGSSDSVLDSITLDLSTGSGSGFTLSLYADNGSSLPGSLLETLTGNASPTAGGLVTYTSSGTALAANTTYWWVASVAAPTAGNFSTVTTGDSAGTSPEGWTFASTYQGNGSGSWNNIGSTAQFSVAATIDAVPEPSTLALAGMGGLGLLMMFRRTAQNAKKSQA